MSDHSNLIMHFLNEAFAADTDELKEGPHIYEGIDVYVYGPRNIRLVTAHDNRHAEDLRDIAYYLVTTLLPETTNNDACDVTIRERSAHFDLHEDLPDYIRNSEFASYIVVDAAINDELT